MEQIEKQDEVFEFEEGNIWGPFTNEIHKNYFISHTEIPGAPEPCKHATDIQRHKHQIIDLDSIIPEITWRIPLVIVAYSDSTGSGGALCVDCLLEELKGKGLRG